MCVAARIGHTLSQQCLNVSSCFYALLFSCETGGTMLCSIVCDLAVARSGSIAIARKFEYSRFMATVDLVDCKPLPLGWSTFCADHTIRGSRRCCGWPFNNARSVAWRRADVRHAKRAETYLCTYVRTYHPPTHLWWLALALLSVCLLVSQSVVYYYTEACLRNSERNVLSKEQHYKLELPPFLPHGRR